MGVNDFPTHIDHKNHILGMDLMYIFDLQALLIISAFLRVNLFLHMKFLIHDKLGLRLLNCVASKLFMTT